MHTFNSDRNFLTWVFSISQYKINAYLKNYYKSKTITKVSIEHAKENANTYENDYSIIINDILSPLNAKQKNIVTLSKIEGYKAKEIAQMMQMSLSAIKVSAHRAYKILRKTTQY